MGSLMGVRRRARADGVAGRLTEAGRWLAARVGGRLVGASLVGASLVGASLAGEAPVKRLSPQIRFIEPEAAVAPLDTRDLASLVTRYRVVDRRIGPDDARILAGRSGRLVNGTGDEVLARHLDARPGQRFGVFEPGRILQDEQERFLGQVMLPLGEARLVRNEGPLAVLELTASRREIGEGAILLEAGSTALPAELTPRPAEAGVSGRILDRPGGGRVAGSRDLLIVTPGAGRVSPGTLLDVFGERTPVLDSQAGETLMLPGEWLGRLLVLETFEHTSLALVIEMSAPVRVGDRLGAPGEHADVSGR